MDRILKWREKSHSLRELSETLKNQTPIEKKIIEARLSGKSLSEMIDKEQKVFCDSVILKCSAYTGCELPHTDYFAEILGESILNFMTGMGYADLTLAEIILAMELTLSHQYRLPGSMDLPEVTFSGRCVNVAYLAKVFSNYMHIRNYLDRRLQNTIDGYE